MPGSGNPPHVSPQIWRKQRIAVQVFSGLFFLILFIITPQLIVGGKIASIPVRLSPLIMFGSSVAARVLIPGLALAGIFLMFALVFGRAWCGWLCPLGSLIEIFPIRKKRITTFNETWRKGKFFLFIALITAVLLGNLSLMVLDPMTIIFRTFTFSIWPALGYFLHEMESFLYGFEFLKPLVIGFDNAIRPAIFPIDQFVYSQALLFFGFFISILLLNNFAERFWCRYLCPLGGLLAWISRFAIFKREVTSDCISCGNCARVCQTGTVDEKSGFQSDPGECTVCMDCVTACPNGSNRFAHKRGLSPLMPYDPTRREALVTIGTAAAGIAVAGTQPVHNPGKTFLIRPPGVGEENFLSQCIRCGECFRICPTNALQPTIFEGGITGFWTPVLVPRIGYCDYSCNSCGQICPVQAIPPLSLKEKRLVKIGSAYIDQDLCIPWTDDLDCGVCEEMCPLPEKAITLNRRGNGKQASRALVPAVNRDLCIGCGICETKCPVIGEAAIQVRIPQ